MSHEIRHFVLRDGSKATLKITVEQYAKAWKLAADTNLVILVPVVNPEGEVTHIPIREFEKERINGFAAQRKAV